MAYDKFLIAPLNEGVRSDLKPWLIPDEAFEEINNAYTFRGRVRKRFGATAMDTTLPSAQQPLSSRLRIKLGTTDGAGNLSGTAPGATFKVGQMFSIGAVVFTVNALGTPAVMLDSGSVTTHTYNTTTGAYVFAGAAATTDVYFYPGEPVMGFTNYETSNLNEEFLYAFDTQFAYKFESNAWDRVGTSVWTGSDTQFFWAANYRGANSYDELLFATNFNEADGIRYWDNSTWTTIAPEYLSGETIESCRLIIPFKDRLLFLNTIETVIAGGTQAFENRCRFCQNGSPLQSDAWREDIAGKGDHIDAPIKQAIVSALIFRDRLIVFFERSTWELVYTGNQVLPFVWQQINIELGAESTFSIVPFDKAMLAIGNTGVHACNGVNVERIDSKIPDAVFDFHDTTDSVFRVQGIRDYKNELVYWSIPNKDHVDVFPSRVLVYNYANNSWALNDDTITAFGYSTSVHEQIIAGNQEGFTFKVDTGTNRNAAALQITDLAEAAGVVTVTAIDHNLNTGAYVLIENCAGGFTELNDNIYQITKVNDDSFTLVNPPAVTGTYAGQGTCTLVSQVDILTKEYNFYTSVGDRTYLAQVDFYVTKTTNGQILVDSSPSSSTRSMVDDGTTSGAILGTNVLLTTAYASSPLEATQDRFWHTIYFQTEGENTQMRLYLDDTMMTDPDIALSYFELHGMVIYAMKTHTF